MSQRTQAPIPTEETLREEIPQEQQEAIESEPIPAPSEASSESEQVPKPAPDPAEELNSLRAELARVRTALAEQETMFLRLQKEARDRTELCRLFPEADPDDLPEEVAEAHANGIPLVAAYALYEKQNAARARQYEAINRRNAERASGRAGVGTSEEYFTPDEVRRMSPSEVRAHFKTIRESMKKWN